MSNDPAQAGHLEHIAKDHVKIAFEYLQAWRIHNLPEQSVAVLSHPHGKRVFPDLHMEFPVFQFVHFVSGPVTGHH